MKQHYAATRLLSITVLLALAIAMSCTNDHVVPEPEPVAGCTRLNGEPRAFPCEFAIEKLEIMSGNSNTNVVSTLTPQDSLLKFTGAPYHWAKTGTESYDVSYKVRLTFKRIAPPPVGQSNHYIVILTAGAIDTEDFLEWSADISGNVAVGETSSQFAILDFHLFTWQSITQRILLLSMLNQPTYFRLMDAPYQYAAVRDRAESWIKFRPATQ